MNTDRGYVIFGADGAQPGQGGVPGPSRGKLYALDPFGNVIWLTLLAGPVHGCPAWVPRGQSPTSWDPNQHGSIFVGTFGNSWSGTPGVPDSGRGRFYRLDATTGDVLAENFVPQANPLPGTTQVVANAASIGPSTSPDLPAPVYVSSSDGTVVSLSQAVADPLPGTESPTLPVNWSYREPYDAAANPTAPAIADNGGAIIVGNAGYVWNGTTYVQTVRALNTADGAVLWTYLLDPVQQVVGAPGLIVDPYLSSQTDHSVWDVGFGTAFGPAPEFHSVFHIVRNDTGADTETPWVDPVPNESFVANVSANSGGSNGGSFSTFLTGTDMGQVYAWT
jgi:hypothetical protein